MARRLKLHDELKELLGTNDCHYQPPESIRLKYPCIIYRLIDTDILRADNGRYRRYNKYGITYITHDPDDPMIEQIEDHFKYCKLVRPYVADDLNHYYYYLFY